jgi:hypothetical protein
VPTVNPADYPTVGYSRVKNEGGRGARLDRAILLTETPPRRKRRSRTSSRTLPHTNDNKRLRDRVVAAKATATGSQILTGQPAPTTIDPQQVFDYVGSHREPPLPVYLRYNKTTGEVTKIEEVYFP